MQQLCKFILLLALLPLAAHSNTTTDKKSKYTKEKSIEKSFSVNSDALLYVENRYGNLDITTWSENRIEMEITIKTHGDDEEKVQERLDDITVNFQSSAEKVEAITSIGKKKSSWNLWNSQNNNVSMEIHYLIKMPETNSVDLSNNYGAISLNKLLGNAAISCDYGKLILGELLGETTDLSFDYTNKSTISYVKNATINADYSEFTIDEAEDIDLLGDYTRSTIKKVNNLHFVCDYGKMEIENGEIINGASRYVSMRFGTVKKHLELDSGYGNIQVERLDKPMELVKIKSEYTNVRLHYDPQSRFDFDISLRFANLKGQDDLEIQKESEKTTEKAYSGYYGSPDSGNQIEVYSSFGNVHLEKL